MLRKQWQYRCSPWWAVKLTQLKKNKIKAVRRFQKIRYYVRNTECPDIVKVVEYIYAIQDHKRGIEHYQKSIHDAKKNSFRMFVTEEGNKKAWGMYYILQAENFG